MEYPKVEDLTPEQRKEILKVLSKAKWNVIGFGFKSVLGMFLASVVTTAISIVIFKDSDLQLMRAFQFCCSLVNSIFMIKYLDRQIKSNNGTINNKIKDILKKPDTNS